MLMAMEWLNYHHLLYFWVVAKEGSVTKASVRLRLAHPTVSGQIHRLEATLGKKLFARKGRNLVLTDDGRTAFRYAEEIFSLGGELMDELQGRSTGQPLRLVVGVSDVLAKSLVHRILEPAFGLGEPVRVVCRENRPTAAFIRELAAHTVDVVLADAPAGSSTPVRTFSHPLGDCGVVFLASPSVAKAHRARFPRSLDAAPFLLPSGHSTLRRSLDEWFDTQAVRPRVVAELDDAALAMVFAEAGLGICAAPDVVEREFRRRYNLAVVGRTKAIRQSFFAISIERKIKHPAVAAICEVARNKIFAGRPG